MSSQQPTPDDLAQDSRDPSLSRTLSVWKVAPTLPLGFAAEVHRRIRTPRVDRLRYLVPWIENWRRLMTGLQHPVVASTYVALGILLGALTGTSRNPSPAPTDFAARARYLAAIDPYQMRSFVPPHPESSRP